MKIAHKRTNSLNETTFSIIQPIKKQDISILTQNEILTQHKNQSPRNSSKSSLPFLHNIPREKEEMRNREKSIRKHILKEMSKLQTIDKETISSRFMHISSNSMTNITLPRVNSIISPIKCLGLEKPFESIATEKKNRKFKLSLSPKKAINSIKRFEIKPISLLNKLDKTIEDFSYKSSNINTELNLIDKIGKRLSLPDLDEVDKYEVPIKYLKDIEKTMKGDFLQLIFEEKDASYSAKMAKKKNIWRQDIKLLKKDTDAVLNSVMNRN
ncbi:unnamed protein product [Blepharisma stoltei]|uniref:Uncharacterized protein n=1 Tax=Blepharisma stoltei TaxID=1481888 RepID=A0AAU9JV92_9CILI|nr:unnamed protein product [Blepharisma stoltei]